MRPPEFTGGNLMLPRTIMVQLSCFNEAAGIHRRKPDHQRRDGHRHQDASMRPPEFTGGNTGYDDMIIKTVYELQ